MRKIGEFNEQKGALHFWNYLKGKGVDSSLEEDDSNWTVWVADEDDIEDAVQDFNEFIKQPDDQKFTTANPGIKPTEEKTPENTDNSNRRFSKNNLRDRWRKREHSTGMFTLSLIITSVAVFVLTEMGNNKQILEKFQLSSEFFNWQFWRLFTPIFVHYTFLHILFNMFWLYDLGNQIERLKGSKFFITFVLTLALVSNLAQFLAEGPSFGGMSGVVYGLFGYVWIKCRLDPGDGFHIDSFIANLMFVWFILCCLGVFDYTNDQGEEISIANWAHAGGLFLGLVWGYGSALRWNRGEK